MSSAWETAQLESTAAPSHTHFHRNPPQHSGPKAIRCCRIYPKTNVPAPYRADGPALRRRGQSVDTCSTGAPEATKGFFLHHSKPDKRTESSFLLHQASPDTSVSYHRAPKHRKACSANTPHFLGSRTHVNFTSPNKQVGYFHFRFL